MKFMLIRIIMACLWITAAYRWGDWKNWKKYYPTMLFFGMGNLIYISVFHAKPLWRLETDFLVSPLNELFIIFTIFFPSTLLFLSNFPKKLTVKVIYIIFWIALYLVIESVTYRIGMITNHNGWNITWSAVHNTVQFPLLALHHKHPVPAWIIAIVFLVIIMRTFNVPFLVGL